MSEFAIQHRLELQLSVNGAPPVKFDSGWVLGAPGSPEEGLSIAIARNGFFCFDQVFSIQAKPVKPESILRYALTAESTYAEGCFEPCLCPIFLGGAMTGSFGLVPLTDAPTTTWNVIDVRIRVDWLLDPGDVLAHFGGFGTLAPADEPRLLVLALELRKSGGDFVTFTSEPFAADPSAKDEIQTTLSMNDLFCYDIALGIAAKAH
jgi:hypothetical protein